MRTTINFISWGVFLMLVMHMTEHKQVTKTNDEPIVRYVMKDTVKKSPQYN